MWNLCVEDRLTLYARQGELLHARDRRALVRNGTGLEEPVCVVRCSSIKLKLEPDPSVAPTLLVARLHRVRPPVVHRRDSACRIHIPNEVTTAGSCGGAAFRCRTSLPMKIAIGRQDREVLVPGIELCALGAHRERVLHIRPRAGGGHLIGGRLTVAAIVIADPAAARSPAATITATSGLSIAKMRQTPLVVIDEPSFVIADETSLYHVKLVGAFETITISRIIASLFHCLDVRSIDNTLIVCPI
mmetsp:Transcript_90362/g.173927  ORF Transcript_90362/g.173927 Transcript_90362/m.173927 type:complete len:245 (+) Transcript_90362:729-1463(+)